MRFWDSSALVPLIVREPRSDSMRALLAEEPAVSIWWASPVECRSALWRRHREGGLSQVAIRAALVDLDELAEHCETIQPIEVVRERASRLLATHPLRAADALHLAAALVRTAEHPRGVGFVSLDDRLREAAEREGFAALPI